MRFVVTLRPILLVFVELCFVRQVEMPETRWGYVLTLATAVEFGVLQALE